MIHLTILSAIYFTLALSVLHTRQLLVFAASRLHPPFTSLFFSPLAAIESSFLSLSTRRGGCRTWNGARTMLEPSGCSWVTAQPPSERSSRTALCVHRRTSDTLGIAPFWKRAVVAAPAASRLFRTSASFRLFIPVFCTTYRSAVSLFAQRWRARRRRVQVPFFTRANSLPCHDFSYPGFYLFFSCRRETNVWDASVECCCSSALIQRMHTQSGNSLHAWNKRACAHVDTCTRPCVTILDPETGA